MPTVGGPAAPPPRPEFIPWDKTGKNQENFGRFGQYEAGMDYLLSKARDAVIKDGPSMSVDYGTGEKKFSPYSGAYIPPEYLGKETIESAVELPGKAFDFIAPAFENEFSELTPQELDTMTEAQARALQAERLASKKPETKDTPLEKSALAAELTGDMKPKPRPKDLFAPTTDNAREGGGSGTGSGSGGMSDYETELMKIMKSREKAAESDKWLALAQVGMGLMQGGSGSFLGDVGAAGMKGLETLRTSRDQADTDKLSLLKAREDARIDRARIAASAAKGTAPNATALKSVIEDLDTAMAPLAARAATGKLTRDEEMQLAQLRDQRNYYSTILGGLAGGSYGAFLAQVLPLQTLRKDATKPPGLIGKGINAVSRCHNRLGLV
jgi:hypothetical protein